MSVKCRELIQLPSLDKLTLVAGEKGLEREVSWPYIGENIIISPWVSGGELMFITGIGMKRDEDSLMKLVEECVKYQLAGLVVSVNNAYISDIPKEVQCFADKMNFPIFTLPWEVRRLEISKEISNYLVRKQMEEDDIKQLYEILCKRRPSVEERRKCWDIFEHYEFTENYAYVALIVRARDRQEEVPLEMQHHKLINRLKSTCFSPRVLTYVHGGEYVFLLTVLGDGRKLSQDVQRFVKEYNEKLPEGETKVVLGLGNVVERKDLGKSIKQARNAVEIVDAEGNSFGDYHKLGFQRVLYANAKSSHAREYCEDVLHNVIDYDRNNEGELLKTLIAYFENSFNTSKTAESLFIHRNSLLYRLSKIEELTGKSLKEPYELYDLVYCAICLVRFIKNV